MFDATPLSLRFRKVFIDFCIEKGISGEKAKEVFKQAINELANNLDFEVKIEKKRPVGIEVILSGEDVGAREREPLVVV